MGTRIIAVLNQKGGVGKTTTCANLSAALALKGKQVLVVDMDPQANLTVHLGLDPQGPQPSSYSLLLGEHTLEQALQATSTPGLRMLPSTLALANAEIQLAAAVGRELILREAFEAWLDPEPGLLPGEVAAAPGVADYIIIDCPPSLGILTMNALCASTDVLLPIQTEFFALQGVRGLLESLRAVQRLNRRLKLSMVLPSMVDFRTNLARDVVEEVRRHFGPLVTKTLIRTNVKLAEAPSHGKTIFEYDRSSRGAADYMSLAAEVLGEDPEPEPEERATTKWVRNPPPATTGDDSSEHASPEPESGSSTDAGPRSAATSESPSPAANPAPAAETPVAETGVRLEAVESADIASQPASPQAVSPQQPGPAESHASATPTDRPTPASSTAIGFGPGVAFASGTGRIETPAGTDQAPTATPPTTTTTPTTTTALRAVEDVQRDAESPRAAVVVDRLRELEARAERLGSTPRAEATPTPDTLSTSNAAPTPDSLPTEFSGAPVNRLPPGESPSDPHEDVTDELPILSADALLEDAKLEDSYLEDSYLADASLEESLLEEDLFDDGETAFDDGGPTAERGPDAAEATHDTSPHDAPPQDTPTSAPDPAQFRAGAMLVEDELVDPGVAWHQAVAWSVREQFRGDVEDQFGERAQGTDTRPSRPSASGQDRVSGRIVSEPEAAPSTSDLGRPGGSTG